VSDIFFIQDAQNDNSYCYRTQQIVIIMSFSLDLNQLNSKKLSFLAKK